tara:strand:- start:819 stop:953 length:135 start_codon:yes stop_codon:yes gene_type:complete
MKLKKSREMTYITMALATEGRIGKGKTTIEYFLAKYKPKANKIA